MNTKVPCKSVQTEIDAFGASGADLSAGSLAHLEECELCRHCHADAKLQRLLQSLVVAPMRREFPDTAIRRAVEHVPAMGVDKHRGTRRLAALAASVAALAMIAGGLVLSYRSAPPAPAAVAQVKMLPQKSKTVRVVLESAQRRDNATITISLAENLELEGFPNERVVEWEAPLLQGKNMLALPLHVKEGIDSHFDVAFRDGQTRQQIRVDIAVVDPPPIA
jgi:hypothetical protein